MHVIISEGNIKLGRISNVNLPPIITCPSGVPCVSKCYALKAYRQYPNVRKAWDHNLSMFTEDPKKYFLSITEQLSKKRKISRFRWHSSGDIINQDYLLGMIRVAEHFPKTRFLAFTKNINVVNNSSNIPQNLTIRLSMWPGFNPEVSIKVSVNRAWMQDGSECRIPKDSFTCVGDCRKCAYCWKGKKEVIFNIH